MSALLIFIVMQMLLFKRRWLFDKHYHFAMRNFHQLVIARFIFLFSLPIGLVLTFSPIFKLNWVQVLEMYGLELLAVGITMVAFTSFELPNLLRPSLRIRPYVGSKDSSRLYSGEKATLSFSIRSLGTHTYKNYGVQVYFPYDESNPSKNFVIIEDSAEYDALDFRKKFSLRKTVEKNKLFVTFSPPMKDYIQPTDVGVFPLRVMAPKDRGRYPVEVFFTCENTWGESRTIVDIEVI